MTLLIYKVMSLCGMAFVDHDRIPIWSRPYRAMKITFRLPQGVTWEMVYQALRAEYRDRLKGNMAPKRRFHGRKAKRRPRTRIPNWAVAATIALLSGRRRGEIAMLDWEHVHRHTGTISWHILKKREPLVVELPMGKELHGVLRQRYLHMGRPASGRVVHGHPRAWSNDFHAWAKRHGWSMKFHDLRHLFALHLVEQGAPLHVVRTALQHSSLAVTSVYLEVHPHDLMHRLPRAMR